MADPQHANARGAAVVASIALGHADAETLASRVRIDREFHPDRANRAVYDERYGELLALYKATRRMHGRMNRHR